MYKIGDKVKIKESYRLMSPFGEPEIFEDDVMFKDSHGLNFARGMFDFCGQKATVVRVIDRNHGRFKLSNNDWCWSAEWLEPIYENEIQDVTENEINSLFEEQLC